MLVAPLPPAVVTRPPAYTSLPATASADTHSVPDQLIPMAVHPRAQCRPTAPVPFGDVIGNHISDDGEAAADVKIAGAIHRRRGNRAACARYAGVHADPVGIAEGRVNAHGIHRVGIIHKHGEPCVGSSRREEALTHLGLLVSGFYN